METKVRVFDGSTGMMLDELSPNGVNRSWKVNGIGDAKFTMEYTDPKSTRRNLEFGNLLLVEHDLLPAWGGVIDTPRKWKKDGIEVAAYAAETLLSWRRGPISMKLDGMDAGQIFIEIINIANKQGDTRIRIGEVFHDGKTRQETVDLTKLNDEINQVARRSGQEWEIIPELDAQGRLFFVANWKQSIGEKKQVVLREGENIALGEVPLLEQGKIVNDLVGFGTGATWDSRPVYPPTGSGLQDADSLARYTLRQDAVNLDAMLEGTLEQNTKNELAKVKEPRRTFQIDIVNRQGESDYEFKNTRNGDTVQLITLTLGFNPSGGFGVDTPVRVWGMAFFDLDPKLALVLEQDGTE